jgi:radical SAM superfamily enzyme YgiQ (UPF0313 family)
MDRSHLSLRNRPDRTSAAGKSDGTGRFIKENLPKPDVFKPVPRRYGRYGLPLSLVKKELRRLPTPDAVFITSGMTYWYPGIVEMTGLLKTIFPRIPIVLGGIYATLCPEHARSICGADHVISGEGEIQALKIADSLTGHQSDVGRYGNPQDFPLPLYELYPVLNSVALLTSRGCPYRCPFCASRLLSKSCSRENPEKVVALIDRLYRDRNVRHFAFYDDALFAQKEEHIIPILNAVIEKKLPLHFHTPNGIQPKEINLHIARLLWKAGFQTLRLSYESGSSEWQKRMAFKVTDADLSSAVKCFFQAGFSPKQLGSYILAGLPGQELGEVLDSIAFVYGLGIKVSLASFSPIPGTECWQDAVDQGLLLSDADPLMTNNTYFPMRSKTIPYHRFLRLGSMVAEANRILNKGGNPLKEPAIGDSMKQLKGE